MRSVVIAINKKQKEDKAKLLKIVSEKECYCIVEIVRHHKTYGHYMRHYARFYAKPENILTKEEFLFARKVLG